MRSRSSLLWLLAAVLGALALYYAAAMVHDTSQQRLAVRLAARAVAERMATHAGTLLDVMALQAFAPVAPWSPPQAAAGSRAERLAAWQAEGERCGCRDLLPAVAFFHFDPSRDVLDIATVVAGAALPDTSLLKATARAEADRAAAGRGLRSHIVAGKQLGDQAVVTMVQRDSAGRPAAVYGAMGNARAVLHRLFMPHVVPGRPDTAVYSEIPEGAIVIGAADTTALLGQLDEDRISATIHPPGPLEGLTVTAALTMSHVLSIHPMGPRRAQLWSLGALFASTIVVTVLAWGSLRREAQLAQARSDFIAGVSHDLRMPLAQVLLASETLTQGRARDDSERAALATSILRETRRLVGLVENVLLVSRTGQVTLTPELRPVALEDCFTDVVEAVTLAVEDAGQRIVAAAPPGLAVRADHRLLRQALVNVVDNALKYGAAGQTIRLDAAPHGAGRVRVSVSDEGPGVPAALRARMFEPYERLPRDQASERTGTGLGLAVVRQIVEACRGRVWIEAGAAQGTTVVIELEALT